MVQEINIDRIQYIAIGGSIFFFLFIFEHIRKKRIKEEYSLLWLLFSLIFLVLSIWRDGLDIISQIIGIAYPPATLFLVLIMAIFSILIHYSMVISALSDKNKTLIQELGIMQTEIKMLKNKVYNINKHAAGEKSIQKKISRK